LSAEKLIESFKEQSFIDGFEVTTYSIQKKVKKDIEYFIVKATKQFNNAKDVIDGGK
jgi:hypothetical protein